MDPEAPVRSEEKRDMPVSTPESRKKFANAKAMFEVQKRVAEESERELSQQIEEAVARRVELEEELISLMKQEGEQGNPSVTGGTMASQSSTVSTDGRMGGSTVSTDVDILGLTDSQDQCTTESSSSSTLTDYETLLQKFSRLKGGNSSVKVEQGFNTPIKVKHFDTAGFLKAEPVPVVNLVELEKKIKNLKETIRANDGDTYITAFEAKEKATTVAGVKTNIVIPVCPKFDNLSTDGWYSWNKKIQSWSKAGAFDDLIDVAPHYVILRAVKIDPLGRSPKQIKELIEQIFKRIRGAIEQTLGEKAEAYIRSVVGYPEVLRGEIDMDYVISTKYDPFALLQAIKSDLVRQDQFASGPALMNLNRFTFAKDENPILIRERLDTLFEKVIATGTYTSLSVAEIDKLKCVHLIQGWPSSQSNLKENLIATGIYTYQSIINMLHNLWSEKNAGGIKGSGTGNTGSPVGYVGDKKANPNKDKTCNHCHKKGHISTDCFILHPEKKTTGKGKQAGGSTKSTDKKKDPKTGLCFKCNKPGHVKKDCPQLSSSGSAKLNALLATNSNNDCFATIDKDDEIENDEAVKIKTPSFAVATQGELGGDERVWVFDSGSWAHCCPASIGYAKEIKTLKTPIRIIMANGMTQMVRKTCKIELTPTLTLINVLMVPNCAANLISAARLVDAGLEVVMKSESVHVFHGHTNLIIEFERKTRTGLWLFRMRGGTARGEIISNKDKAYPENDKTRPDYVPRIPKKSKTKPIAPITAPTKASRTAAQIVYDAARAAAKAVKGTSTDEEAARAVTQAVRDSSQSGDMETLQRFASMSDPTSRQGDVLSDDDEKDVSAALDLAKLGLSLAPTVRSLTPAIDESARPSTASVRSKEGARAADKTVQKARKESATSKKKIASKAKGRKSIGYVGDSEDDISDYEEYFEDYELPISGSIFMLKSCFKVGKSESKVRKGYVKLLHNRLNHIGSGKLKQLNVLNNLGLTNKELDYDNKRFCDVCALAKLKRRAIHKTYDKSTSNIIPAEGIYDRVYTDICGPITAMVNGQMMRVRSTGGDLYFSVIIDEYSRYVSVSTIKKKDHVSSVLSDFVELVHTQTGKYPREVHSDNGGEFINSVLYNSFRHKGIKHTTITVETPQHNALAERANGKLIPNVKVVLAKTGCTKSLWAEALHFVNYVNNRLPITVVHEDENGQMVKTISTPYELRYGRLGNLKLVKTWGCDSYFSKLEKTFGKLDETSRIGFYIGVDESQNCFKIFHVNTLTIRYTRDATFDEQSFAEIKKLKLKPFEVITEEHDENVKDTSVSIDMSIIPAPTSSSSSTNDISIDNEDVGTLSEEEEQEIMDAQASQEEDDVDDVEEMVQQHVTFSPNVEVREFASDVNERNHDPPDEKTVYQDQERRASMPPLDSGQSSDDESIDSNISEQIGGESDDQQEQDDQDILVENYPSVKSESSIEERLHHHIDSGDSEVNESVHDLAQAAQSEEVQRALSESEPSSTERDLDIYGPSPLVRRSTRISQPVEKLSYGHGFKQGIFSISMLNEYVPVTYEQAISCKEASKWIDAMNTEVESVKEKKVFQEVSLPEGARALPCKWVFRNKLDSDGKSIKKKARIVVKGFMQKAGVDFDEVWSLFAPTARAKSLKMLLSLAAQEDMIVHVIDFVVAFLNATLQECIYVKIPQHFKAESSLKNVVYKLNKSLYGLRQAPVRWYETLIETMTKLGYVACVSDPCILIKRIDKGTIKGIIIIDIYVDDVAVFISRGMLSVWEDDRNKLNNIHQLKNLGEIKKLLNTDIVVNREKGTISMSQEQYVTDIISKYGLNDANICTTPSLISPLTQQQIKDAQPLDKGEHDLYRSIVGSLSYAAITTRLDIAYATNKCAQALSSPNDLDMVAAKRIIRYLKGTKDLKLIFKRNEKAPMIEAYSDSNWGGDSANKDSKSTSGMIVKFMGNIIFWSSKKQQVVALSSAEAEYVSLSSVVSEVRWLNSITSEIIQIECENIKVNTDSTSAIAIAQTSGNHARTKHISIKVNSIREHVRSKLINLVYVKSEDNIADILTKALSKMSHDKITHQALK